MGERHGQSMPSIRTSFFFWRIFSFEGFVWNKPKMAWVGLCKSRPRWLLFLPLRSGFPKAFWAIYEWEPLVYETDRSMPLGQLNRLACDRTGRSVRVQAAEHFGSRQPSMGVEISFFLAGTKILPEFVTCHVTFICKHEAVLRLHKFCVLSAICFLTSTGFVLKPYLYTLAWNSLTYTILYLKLQTHYILRLFKSCRCSSFSWNS